jgi:hypothetical protein
MTENRRDYGFGILISGEMAEFMGTFPEVKKYSRAQNQAIRLPARLEHRRCNGGLR